MRYLLWLLKAAIFFTLFAFALNNQHDATVYFFFGTSWRAPLVLVVLAAFAGGMAVGALGMLPGWWRHRRAAAQQSAAAPPAPDAPADPVVAAVSPDPGPVMARQHGL
ncbi:MAG: LapA family protein [Xenophilus sp.]